MISYVRLASPRTNISIYARLNHIVDYNIINVTIKNIVPLPGGYSDIIIIMNIQIYILITFGHAGKILRRVPHNIIIYNKFKRITIFIYNNFGAMILTLIYSKHLDMLSI